MLETLTFASGAEAIAHFSRLGYNLIACDHDENLYLKHMFNHSTKEIVMIEHEDFLLWKSYRKTVN